MQWAITFLPPSTYYSHANKLLGKGVCTIDTKICYSMCWLIFVCGSHIVNIHITVGCIALFKYEFFRCALVNRTVSVWYASNTKWSMSQTPKFWLSVPSWVNNSHSDFWLGICPRSQKMGDSSAVAVAFHLCRSYCINAMRSPRENINVRFSLNISQLWGGIQFNSC